MNLSNDTKEDIEKTTPRIKNFLTKMSGKKSEPQEQKESKTPIDENLTLNEEENVSSAPTDIEHGQIWRDCRNFRKDFKWELFGTNMLLGLAPSAFDIGTDFSFAMGLAAPRTEKELAFPHLRFASLSFLCIALPGLVYAPILLKKTLERWTKQCSCHSLLTNVISNVCSLGLVAAIIIGISILIQGDDISNSSVSVLVCKILAGIVATVMLGIKALPMFVHTESVKKLAVKASNYEGSYESTLQLLLNILLWVIGYQELNRMAMASSLVMIAKTCTENFLTFGAENKLSDERSFLSKLRTQAKFIPAFSLTGFFRVGTLALLFSQMQNIVPVAIIVLGLPLVVLLLMKMCGKLPDLSLAEIVQGLFGEGTSIVLWGSTGREGSRKIQLWVGGYLLFLYTAVLVVLAALKGKDFMNIDYLKNLPTALIQNLQNLENLPTGLIQILLASGWIGYGLFIYQVFLFNRYNVDWRKKILYMGSIIIF